MKKLDAAYLRNIGLVFVWWTTLILLTASFLWAVDYYQRLYYANAVDRVLAAKNDSRRVENIQPSWGPNGPKDLSGRRFLLDDQKTIALVFSLNYASQSNSYIVLWNSDERGISAYPLNEAARISLDRLPSGVFDLYLNRIAKLERYAETMERKNGGQ